MRLFISLILLGNLYLIGCNNQEKQDQTVNDQATTETNISDEKTESKGQVVFKVNGKPYFKEDLGNRDIQSVLQDAILYEAAILEGKDKDPVYLKQIEIYKKNVLLGRYKGEIIKKYLSTKKITDEDINKFYEDNKARFATLNLTKFSTQDKETADNIYKYLKDGKNPDEIKSIYSDIFTVKLDFNVFL